MRAGRQSFECHTLADNFPGEDVDACTNIILRFFGGFRNQRLGIRPGLTHLLRHKHSITQSLHLVDCDNITVVTHNTVLGVDDSALAG